MQEGLYRKLQEPEAFILSVNMTWDGDYLCPSKAVKGLRTKVSTSSCGSPLSFSAFSWPILFNSKEKEKMFFPFSYSEHSNCLQPKPFYPPWLILCLSRCFLLQGHFPQKARMGKNGQGEGVLVCVVISTVILLEINTWWAEHLYKNVIHLNTRRGRSCPNCYNKQVVLPFYLLVVQND